MKSGYRVEIEGAEELAKVFDQFPELAVKAFKPAVTKSVLAIEAEAKPAAPHFMGRLRSSITTSVKTLPKNVIGQVGPAMGKEIYPLVMEFGRKPGSKAPPPQALYRWVQLKLKPEPEDVPRIARRLAWKIGRFGIKGREYMRQGIDKAEPKIIKAFDEALENLVKDLGE